MNVKTLEAPNGLIFNNIYLVGVVGKQIIQPIQNMAIDEGI